MTRNKKLPTLEQFISYLRTTGFRQARCDDDRLLVFAKDVPGEDPDLVTLPANESFTNSAALIEFALQRLSQIEERYICETWRDMLEQEQERRQ